MLELGEFERKRKILFSLEHNKLGFIVQHVESVVT